LYLTVRLQCSAADLDQCLERHAQLLLVGISVGSLCVLDQERLADLPRTRMDLCAERVGSGSLRATTRGAEEGLV
jgi:hypothetical protein